MRVRASQAAIAIADSEGLAAVVAAFGEGVLAPDGTLVLCGDADAEARVDLRPGDVDAGQRIRRHALLEGLVAGQFRVCENEAAADLGRTFALLRDGLAIRCGKVHEIYIGLSVATVRNASRVRCIGDRRTKLHLGVAVVSLFRHVRGEGHVVRVGDVQLERYDARIAATFTVLASMSMPT